MNICKSTTEESFSISSKWLRHSKAATDTGRKQGAGITRCESTARWLSSMVARGQRASTQGYLSTTLLATSVFGFIGTGDGKWLVINPRPLQMKSEMRRRTYLTDPHPQRLKPFKTNFLDNCEVSPTLVTH